MKFLLLSDIHNNVSAVEKMRVQEANSFDALVVAGDIGSDCAQQIFDILATFNCPILYIYGNWDHRLVYDASFGNLSHHLHLSPFDAGPVTFVGFSGCNANWGQNPEALRLHQAVEDAHSGIICALNNAENEFAQQKVRIEGEYTASVNELMEKPSRRTVPKGKLNALEARRDRQLVEAAKVIDAVKGTDAYSLYLHHRSSVTEQVLVCNRYALSQLLPKIRKPRDRIVVVTHDRLAKTQADFVGIPVFLFGHRHGFAQTNYQGAKYINVSALDLRRTIRPKVFSKGDHFKQFRNINLGNYAVMEWHENVGVNVVCMPLDIDPDWQVDWQFEMDFQMPGAPFLAQ